MLDEMHNERLFTSSKRGLLRKNMGLKSGDLKYKWKKESGFAAATRTNSWKK
jgi:hypothetical protein